VRSGDSIRIVHLGDDGLRPLHRLRSQSGKFHPTSLCLQGALTFQWITAMNHKVSAALGLLFATFLFVGAAEAGCVSIAIGHHAKDGGIFGSFGAGATCSEAGYRAYSLCTKYNYKDCRIRHETSTGCLAIAYADDYRDYRVATGADQWDARARALERCRGATRTSCQRNSDWWGCSWVY
jgi:hypothetical protein